MDHDDNGENTNRPPKPPYPEEPDGLEDTDNQEPETEDTSEEDNETDDSDHVYEEDDSRPLVVRFPKSWNATRRDHALRGDQRDENRHLRGDVQRRPVGGNVGEVVEDEQ